MRDIIIFVAATFVIAVSFFIISPLSSPTGYVVIEEGDFSKELSKNAPDFRVYTVAVCKNVSGFILCKDEQFASCNGLEYLIPSGVNGTGEFEENWTDPRIN